MVPRYWIVIVIAVVVVTCIGLLAASTHKPTGLTISNVRVEKGSDYATIYWTTNQLSDSVIKYWPSENPYLDKSKSDSALVTAHEITITGLNPQTEYHYELFSTDAGGKRARAPADESKVYVFTTTPKVTAPEIVLADYTSSPVSSAYLDSFYLDDTEITLRNEGGASAEIYELILTIGGEEFTRYPMETLGSWQEATYSIRCYGSVDREIGTYSFTGKLEVQDSDYRTLFEQDLNFTVPALGMDDTIPEIPWTDNMSLTLLSWRESYTVTYLGTWDEPTTVEADPGWKFIILNFRFTNNSIRVQDTPYISSGEIATDEGYIYSLTPYSDEVGYEELYQGESIEGFLTFQIPDGATPVEADLEHIDPLVRF